MTCFQKKGSKRKNHIVETFTSPEGIVLLLYVGCRFLHYMNKTRNKWLISIMETVHQELHMKIFYHKLSFDQQKGIFC
jgi:hypothetical protein